MTPSASADIPRLYRPTWAEIDLGALRSNIRKIRARTKTPVMLVVKANGYGHGAVEVARAAAPSCAWFGVSSVEEGVALREAGVKRPILILGSLYPFESTMAAIRYGLTPTVASLEGARLIARAAAAVSSFSPGRRGDLACHLKVDTGMGRVGVRWPAGLEAARYLKEAPGVRLEGLFTHLARAEDEDESYSRAQLARFGQALRDVAKLGIRLKWRHAANSAAALRLKSARFDLVRPGLAAYGLMDGFSPVLSLKTRIVFLKSVPAGAWLSYGAHYRTKRPARIATLPIGYGDGLHRRASLAKDPMSVLVDGRRCPIVGAMTMDMTLVDVTGAPGAQVGSEAVLIGSQGRETVGADDWARRAGAISYEILSHLHSRIPRVYLGR